MSEPIKEQKWACGCFAENGRVVVQCTQQKPAGEVSAERHASSSPFSPKCFRKAAEAAAEVAQEVGHDVKQGAEAVGEAAVEVAFGATGAGSEE
jgi:hypothetical protein